MSSICGEPSIVRVAWLAATAPSQQNVVPPCSVPHTRRFPDDGVTAQASVFPAPAWAARLHVMVYWSTNVQMSTPAPPLQPLLYPEGQVAHAASVQKKATRARSEKREDARGGGHGCSGVYSASIPRIRAARERRVANGRVRHRLDRGRRGVRRDVGR